MRFSSALRLRGAFMLGMVALTGCSSSKQEKAAETPASLTVRITRPQSLSWARKVTASGALAAWQEAVISAETGPYRVTALRADVGSRVRKGQALATLARDSLNASRAQLEASVAEAQANLRKADSDVARAKAVGDSGALSVQQIESYRVTQQTAQATLASARAQLRSVQVQLGQTSVVAVDDGIVSSRSALLGKVVNAGDELFRLVRQSRIEWQAELDARQLAQVKAGRSASVTLPGGQSVTGTVRLVSPTLNTDTSRGIVYVQLPASSPARAGMYGSGTIEVGKANVLTLPETGVVLRDGKAYVFAVGKDNKVRQREVTAGQRRDGRVEISGLAADVDVVATGASFLSDGASVRVQRSDGK